MLDHIIITVSNYGAFVFDSDANNIEAVCHEPV
jgi:hypothetical protein